jgi:hypothetical protein
MGVFQFNVILLSVILLNVVAPYSPPSSSPKIFTCMWELARGDFLGGVFENRTALDVTIGQLHESEATVEVMWIRWR